MARIAGIDLPRDKRIEIGLTIELTFQSEVVEFSPYISLESGNVQVGEKGLNLTLTE